MFCFKCAACDEWHIGMPSFSAPAPLYYTSVPEAERATRCKLTSDLCVVDDEFFFLHGLIEIPVHCTDEPFTWGVWVSLSRASFKQVVDLYDTPERDGHGPFFGWLSTRLNVYPDPENLRTAVHLRNNGARPRILLEPTDHPLAVEQRAGITSARVAEIYAFLVH